jgi:hypothetical protein
MLVPPLSSYTFISTSHSIKKKKKEKRKKKGSETRLIDKKEIII